MVASESRLLAQRDELQAQSDELKLGVEDLRAQLDEAARQREQTWLPGYHPHARMVSWLSPLQAARADARELRVCPRRGAPAGARDIREI